MSGRPRGRPPKNRNPRGRLAAKIRQTAAALFRPSSSPEPDPAAPHHTPPPSSGIRPLTHEESIYAALASQEFGVPLAAYGSSTDGPLFLDTVKRKKPAWRSLGHVSTVDIPHWFDAQQNDFNCWKAHTRTEAADVIFFGHPGDSPVDIRARPFIIRWKRGGILSSYGQQDAIDRKRVVVRWEYKCRGICSVVQEEPDSASSTASEDGTSIPAKKQSRWKMCNGDVRLVIEVTANDLTRANIWQFGEHTDATPEQGLHWSRRLRSLVSERLRLGGAKVSTIQKELIARYNFPQKTTRPTKGTPELPAKFPEFRRPTAAQLRAMFPAVRRRERLHKDPFQAVHLLHERNPDKIYNYVAHDPAQPDSKSRFTCGITDKHALERLILHGCRDGIGCDTSWRNKNENRAAVTFLTVVDKDGHLTPGSALLSANIKEETLFQYLEATKERVVQRAKEIEADPNNIAHTRQEDREELRRLAGVITKEGWHIPKWMIDKSPPELHAIKRADPGAPIRICQFHIVQAIVRWDCDDGTVAAAPRIPVTIKFGLVKLFRDAQRCRSLEEWPAYEKNFLTKAEELIMSQNPVDACNSSDPSDLEHDSSDHPAPSKPKRNSRMETDDAHRKQWAFVERYFVQNWFTEEWQLQDNGVYCPAHIIALDDATQTARLECLPEILPGEGTPATDRMQFVRTWDQCAEALGEDGHDPARLSPSKIAKISWPWALDSSWLHELDDLCAAHDTFDPSDHLSDDKKAVLTHLESELASISGVILRQNQDLEDLMLQWDEHTKQQWSTPTQMTFEFSNPHLVLLDAIDRFLLSDVCVPRLLRLWRRSPSTSDINFIQSSLTLASGLGLAVMAYYVLGFYLHISPESAWKYRTNEQIFRRPSPQECAWDVMCVRAMTSPQETYRFARSHRITSSKIDLFPIEIHLDTNVKSPTPAPSPVEEHARPLRKRTLTRKAEAIITENTGWRDINRVRPRKN